MREQEKTMFVSKEVLNKNKLFFVERIVDTKVDENNQKFYEVKWQGYDKEGDNTVEPLKNLIYALESIWDFYEEVHQTGNCSIMKNGVKVFYDQVTSRPLNFQDYFDFEMIKADNPIDYQLEVFKWYYFAYLRINNSKFLQQKPLTAVAPYSLCYFPVISDTISLREVQMLLEQKPQPLTISKIIYCRTYHRKFMFCVYLTSNNYCDPVYNSYPKAHFCTIPYELVKQHSSSLLYSFLCCEVNNIEFELKKNPDLKFRYCEPVIKY